MALDEVLRAESQNRVTELERRLGVHDALGGGADAVAEEEHAVRLDEHYAGVGAVVAAEMPHVDDDAAEVEVDAVLVDDVGRSDLDGPRRRQLRLHVRAVLRGCKPLGDAPVEPCVAPVSRGQLVERLGSQRLGNDEPAHLGAAQDVIPVSVRVDDRVGGAMRASASASRNCRVCAGDDPASSMRVHPSPATAQSDARSGRPGGSP